MPQNRVLHCSFGPYPAGEVVPEHVFVGHDLAALEERGLVAPTDKPVTVALVETAKDSGPPDDVYAERNRLAAENRRLADDNKRLAGLAAELERTRAAQVAQLGRQTAEIADLRAACDDHQKALERSEKDKEGSGGATGLAVPPGKKKG